MRQSKKARKLSRAAVLALSGWYLIAPPLKANEINLKAPIWEWDTLGSFESARACSDGRERQRQLYLSRPDLRALKVGMDRTIASICIAADDPRLAK